MPGLWPRAPNGSMTTPAFDVLVLGAGPSGATAAALLARTGVRVALINADAPAPVAPRIESLPTQGQRLALDLGLARCLAQARVGEAAGLDLAWRTLDEQISFETPGPLLLERRHLHHALRDSARRAGAAVLRGHARDLHETAHGVAARVGSETLTARLAIDARGRRSAKGKAAGQGAGLIAIGFSATVGPGAAARMRLIARPRAWIWMAVLANGTCSGALFVDPRVPGGKTQAQRAGVVQQALGASVEGLRVLRPTDASLSARARAFSSPRILRIGDAALARDPISSHGLAHALRSAAHASVATRTLLDEGGQGDAALAFIEERHREATGAAITATGQAYADQCRHATSFWRDRAQAAPPGLPGPPGAITAPSGRLKLAAPLRRAAVLNRDRIVWQPVLGLAGKAGGAAFIGPLDAATLAGALASPAPREILVKRIATLTHAANARQIIDILIREQGLVAALPTKRLSR